MSQTESLTDRTTRAAQWRFAGAGVAAVARFAIGIVLARLLSPADFGVVALAFVVLGLAGPLGDLGVGSAVVQRARLTERHVRAGFTLALLLGLAMAALVAGLAPLGAWLLGDPHVSSVLRWLSAGFAVQGAGVVAGALLRRRLDFRHLFVIETSSYVLGYGAVAITLAGFGFGVWSLVWGGLSQSVLASCALLGTVRHSVRPSLARQELSELLHFGLGASISAGINYVALNADNFVIGRWMGAASLGLYNRAYSLMSLPHTYAGSVLSATLLPAFSKVQAERARLRRGYLLATQLTAMLTASAMATLAIAAPHLVRALYGQRWAGLVAPLQILCVAGYFRALYHLGGSVAQSVGRVYSEMWRQAVYASLVIVGALIGTRYGLWAVAVGVGIAILYMFIATAQLALNATGTSWRVYFGVQTGALATAVITSAVALYVRLLLEAKHAGSAATAFAIVAAAAIPWAVGMGWNLAGQEFEPVRASLPRGCAQAIVVNRPSRQAAPAFDGSDGAALIQFKAAAHAHRTAMARTARGPRRKPIQQNSLDGQGTDEANSPDKGIEMVRGRSLSGIRFAIPFPMSLTTEARSIV